MLSPTPPQHTPLVSSAPTPIPRRPPTHAPLQRDLSTVVLIDEAGAHVRSTAALRVLRHLGTPYQCLYSLVLIPRPLRDLGYKLVAASRYSLFGKDEEVCRRMSAEIKRRFLAETRA